MPPDLLASPTGREEKEVPGTRPASFEKDYLLHVHVPSPSPTGGRFSGVVHLWFFSEWASPPY